MRASSFRTRGGKEAHIEDKQGHTYDCVDGEGVAGDLGVLQRAMLRDVGVEDDGTVLGDQGKERGIKIEILPHHGVHQEKFDPIADGEDQKIAPGDQAQALPDLVRIVHMDPVAHCDQDQGWS